MESLTSLFTDCFHISNEAMEVDFFKGGYFTRKSINGDYEYIIQSKFIKNTQIYYYFLYK